MTTTGDKTPAGNTGFASPRPDSIFASAIASADNSAGRGERKARERPLCVITLKPQR
jgi:hypothetical protein